MLRIMLHVTVKFKFAFVVEAALSCRKIISILFRYSSQTVQNHFSSEKTRIDDRRVVGWRGKEKMAVFHGCSFAARTRRRKDLAERTKVSWTKRCPFNPKRRHLKSLLRICRVDWQIEANNVAWPRVERRKSWRERGGGEVDGWWGREKKRRWKRQSLVERRVINSD